MIDFILNYYLWIKAFHIVAMVAWMAGLFYLPRLYVYHSTVKPKSQTSEIFKTMEMKLLRFIMNPAMITTWVLGVGMMMANPAIMQGGWMHAKITLVLVMSGFHGALAVWRKKFARDERPHSEKFFRYANEVPTVLLIAIVVLVMVQPF